MCKNRDFWKNSIFYKIDIVGLKWESMKNMKKAGENRFKINLFFDVDFFKISEPTWVDFGFQVEALERHPPRPFSKLRPRGGRAAPKRLPRAP